MEIMRTIFHVDLDAFFASVEQLDFPGYRGKPVIVGADPMGGRGRGVVSTCSYEARKFGIHSAMPISQAYAACPHGIYVRPRMDRYVEMSKWVMDIFSNFTPIMEPISIDEAFLDMTGTDYLFESKLDAARLLKKRVRDETGLTASVGVAPNKFVAKIASDLEKPDGLTICEPGKELEFLSPLPIKRLWGVGKKTLPHLEEVGIHTIGDMATANPHNLVQLLGSHAFDLWRLSNGIDDRPVENDYVRKSISEERTFMEDVSDENYLKDVLFFIADELSRRMRNQKFRGKTITLKIRLTGFQTYTRSNTLKEYVNDMKSIRETAVRLFENFDRNHRKVRLIGIGVSNLDIAAVEQEEQMDLFAAGEEDSVLENHQKLDQVIDSMKKKFGDQIQRASFLGKSLKRTFDSDKPRDDD